MPLPRGIRGILLDVEGTTTPVAFVYETLFPFARVRLESTCARAGEDTRIAEAVRRLREESGSDAEFGDGAPYARRLMDQDRKSTGLKALQGIIWEEGYRSGELRAPVFADVAPAFRAWRRAGARLRIFSSGSVLAQKLLFAHTDQGDLTPLLEGYHDTTTGPKKEAASYAAIAEQFALPAEQILFLSDVVGELDAARQAGMLTALLARPGNAEPPSHDHETLPDFRPLF